MATIRDVAEVLIKINDEEAKKQLPALQKKVEELGKEFDELRKNGATNEAIKEQGEKFKKTFEQMDALRRRTQSVDEAMQHLSTATPKELRRILSQINRELNSGHIERGTKEWDEYNEKLKQVKTELKNIADEQKVVTNAGMSKKDMLDIGGNLSMIHTFLVDTGEYIYDYVQNYVESFVALDAEMANVRKYTGMTREEVEQLNEEFKSIDTRTSVVELNKLAQEAGRLGKTSQEDVLGFVKAADIINVALDDLGEGATLTISKLTNIFGDEKVLGTEKSMLAVGSVINELSQNCTASAPYMADFAKRLAGVGAQAEMTIPQIMGFAAVLDSQGQAVEMSATAVSQLITKLFQDPAKIAKATGMDIKEFTEIIKNDTNGALLVLLERLNSMGNMDVLAPIFKEMGTDGARASAVLAALAGNIDMVRRQQEIATQAYNEATSVVKEFNVQNETEEAKLEKKRKKLEEVKVALGEKLLPVMGVFTSTGTMMMQTIGALLDVFNQYKTTIISTGSAVLLYTGYVKAKNIITAKEITLEKAKIVLQEKSLLLLKKVGLAIKSNPWGIAIVAVTTIIGLLIDYNKRLNKVSESEKALGKIRNDAKQKVAEEEIRLKALIKTAKDETASLESRKKAVDALNSVIPNYNAELDTTTGKYKDNKLALDEYIKSLTKKYEIEGAKATLGELGEEKARLSMEKVQAKKNLAEAENLANSGTRISGREGRMMDTGTGGFIAKRKEELNEIEEQLDAIIEKEEVLFKIYDKDLTNSIADDIMKGKSSNVNGYTGGASDEQTKKEIALAEQTAKEKWARQRAIEDAAYSRGEITYQQHVERLHQAELQYLDDCQAAYEQRNMTEENGYSQLLEKKKQLAQKQYDQLLNMSLEKLERQKQTELNEVLENCYDVNSILFGNETVRDQRLFEINIDYLQKKAALYRQAAMSKEAHQIEQQIAQAEADEALRKQREYAERLQQWRKEYAGSSSEVQMQAELTVLDEMHKTGLVKEEEYQELRNAIQEKYSGGGKFSDGGYGDMLTNMYTSIDALISSTTDKSVLSMEKIGAVAQSTWAIAGAALQQYSAYSQACCDVEVAEIEKKYDKMIAAAGKNSTKAKQLEEQKEKQIAKVKNKYSKQAQKIEIAGAIAQTAVAAINAYASASKENWLLGPIAAAMAIAAGAIQIATIRKQHQAQQAGYFTGGYTKRSYDDREEVGVVHANEFVANAAATRNPALAPIFNLIDHAQRNNTIGSLTSSDVSHALGTGAIVKATSTTANESVQNSGELLAVAGSISSNTKVVQRLNKRLDEGIEAFMVMDGERGFDNRYNEYNKLKNNPKR